MKNIRENRKVKVEIEKKANYRRVQLSYDPDAKKVLKSPFIEVSHIR